MIRNIVLLDGTWNTPHDGSNICKLSTHNAFKRLIAPRADGVEQRLAYFNGVGTDGLKIEKFLGGAAGIGLRTIVQEAYDWVIDNYRDDQELYIFGFSRGAYAARALAGLIGASGIPKAKDKRLLDIAWTNYRARKADRSGAPATGGDRQTNNRVRLLGVFDTVGSYGVPAGVSGLAPLARYISLAAFGFHDTRFGGHIGHGLHAIGVDERRRPFTPTFWTVAKGAPQPANVEQTWFPGVHCNVGGGYDDHGLSDIALIWMIARARALTGLAFDLDAVRAALKPDIDGEVVDSAKGWAIDQTFPLSRPIFSPSALSHGYFSNAGDAAEEHVNERLHWSVLAKLGRPCRFYGKDGIRYDPPNLKEAAARLGPGFGGRIAAVTAQEEEMLPRELADRARVSA